VRDVPCRPRSAGPSGYYYHGHLASFQTLLEPLGDGNSWAIRYLAQQPSAGAGEKDTTLYGVTCVSGNRIAGLVRYYYNGAPLPQTLIRALGTDLGGAIVSSPNTITTQDNDSMAGL